MLSKNLTIIVPLHIHGVQPQFPELIEVRLELHGPLVGAVNVKPLCTAGYVNPFVLHEDAVNDVAFDEAFLFDEEVGV